jgi:cytochrome d ubiquinol oxidase subunit II
MPEIGPPEIVGGVLLLSLTAYLLLGGADFGGGVWDLLARGPRRERQRELVAEAIGPIWEANHVWLILVVVLAFTCFPPVFARVGTVLHVPLTLMLVGIVLRGSAFTFRHYDSRRDAVQRRWGAVFSGASVVTPVLLGVCIGAIASGRVGQPAGTSFADVYVRSWLAPFPFAVGLLTLALVTFLAAVYLTVEADEPALREDFRRRALAAAGAVFLAAALTLALAGEAAPRVREGLTRSAWALPLHLATAAAAIGAIAALVVRRFRTARIAAAAQVSLILWGWALAQAPYLVPPTLSLRAAASPATTLRFVLLGLAGGALLLVPSLWYLFRVFKGGSVSAFERVDRGRE